MLAAFLPVFRSGASQYCFQVTFTDKNNTPYSLSSPSSYLSARSLARRTTQGIAVDSTDLPVNRSYVDSVLTLTGGVLHITSRWLNLCVILLSDSSQITQLSGVSFISNVKCVGYYSTDLHHRATYSGSPGGTPPVRHKTSSFNSTYYSGSWDQTHIVNGDYLHDNGFQGQGKLIAVMDAGFVNSNGNPGFDSLRQSGRLVDSFDFVWRDNNILQADDHGALVLSTMAGYLPGTYVGTAPLASYALYLTENNVNDQPVELDNLLAASERADSIGADVITESLGYDIFDYPPGAGQVFLELDGKTTVGARAANMATKKGMLFVATAGNDGTSVPGWGTHILTPGDADSALTIGSTDVSGAPAASSSYGPNAAGRIKPDVSGMGHTAVVITSGGITTAGDGTSFSTPQIAGWAACLWQANPTATPYMLRQAIIKCASSYNSPGAQLGYGVPDFVCTEQMVKVPQVAPVITTYAISVAPNPFTNEMTIAIASPSDGLVSVVIADIAGRTVYSGSIYCSKGPGNLASISLNGASPGLYFLRATTAAWQQVIKLIKE